MSPKEQYAVKLRDPRWQKRRLEVFQRDNFRCVSCHSKDRELHVHHLVYSGEPWDGDLENLETLCAECHDERERANKWLIELIRSSGTSSLLELKQAIERVHDIHGHLDGATRAALYCTHNPASVTAYICSQALNREFKKARRKKQVRAHS